jgi:hypothetical protein
MRFVMVPVPREHVLDVMRWVLFRAPADDDPSGMRDHARIKTFLEDTDPVTRSVLQLLAKATSGGDALRLTDVTEQLEAEADVVRGILREINRSALGGGRDLVQLAPETTVGVQGQTGRVLYLRMRPEHASVVRQLIRSAPSPEG